MNKTAARQIIKPLLERSGSTVKLKLKSRFPGGRNVGGKYTMNDHSVTLYLEEIRIQAVNIFGSAEYTDEVLKIIAAHELGHAQDPELELLSERLDECPSDREFNLIALQIEENAWNFARTILPEVESGLLDTMIYFSLKAYRDAVAEGIA